MDDDLVDNAEEMSLIVVTSCVDWMMRWITYMSKELYLSTYSGSSLYSWTVYIYIYINIEQI
jgi:hypothetical protein